MYLLRIHDNLCSLKGRSFDKIKVWISKYAYIILVKNHNDYQKLPKESS